MPAALRRPARSNRAPPGTGSCVRADPGRRDRAGGLPHSRQQRLGWMLAHQAQQFAQAIPGIFRLRCFNEARSSAISGGSGQDGLSSGCREVSCCISSAGWKSYRPPGDDERGALSPRPSPDRAITPRHRSTPSSWLIRRPRLLASRRLTLRLTARPGTLALRSRHLGQLLASRGGKAAVRSPNVRHTCRALNSW